MYTPVILHVVCGCDGKYFFICELYEVQYSPRKTDIASAGHGTFELCLLVGSGELVCATSLSALQLQILLNDCIDRRY